MSAQSLTARQIETIRHIHEFISRNGMPPSIGDLRKALGLASDQAVIEILQRLETRGMVERAPGQARGLRLTAEACLTIGVRPGQPSGGPRMSTGDGRPFELNPQQQRIFERLANIDTKLARMYEGGLRVLLDESNPERIALSAHSMRESTYHLSNMGKGLLTKQEEVSAKAQRSSNARQLEKLFDPLGGVGGVGSTVYDTWSREFHDYFVQVSHHGLEPTVDEFRERLTRFEDFLSRYVLPLQVEIYAQLDEQLQKGPETADADEIRSLLSRNVESYRYFFRKADLRWLEYLLQQNLIVPTWEVADYLARIAPAASERVMVIIDGMRTTEADWITRRSLIGAALKMPPAIARRLVDKMEREKWFVEAYVDWLVYSLDDLIDIFIGSELHSDAVRLIALLLHCPDGRTPLRAHHYGEILKRISKVPAYELAPYIRLLVDALAAAISKEGSEKDDLSYMWRPAIEDHPQNWRHGEPKDILITALRDALCRYVDHLNATGEERVGTIVDDLLRSDPPFSTFVRLKLHLYRQNPVRFMSEIEGAVTEHAETTTAWHEYFLLLESVFAQLGGAIQSRYLALLDKGPSGDRDENYVRRWKARRLAPILRYLRPDAVAKYQELIELAGTIQHPDLLSYHSGGWVGSASPSSEAELLGMPIDQVFNLLTSWTPPDDEMFSSSSRAGLGLALSRLVSKKSEAFSKEAHRFVDPRIWPVYLYHLFLGLQEGLKSNPALDWKSILSLATTIVERAKTGALPTFAGSRSHDAWEADWEGVFRELGALLEAGLNSSTAGPAFAYRDELFKIIEFLCEHPDPTLEYEQKNGGNNSNFASLSINTVRGRAFRTLFAYVFWCDRHLGGKSEHGSRIPQEVKRIAELHLDQAHDPGLTIRSVYGEFFQWIYVYDPPWATQLIDRVFPVNDPERRYAAWEMYLANGLFPKLYKVLKGQYEQAIAEVRNFKPERRYWADPIEGLAIHLMVAYAYREEEEKGASWLKFFRVASPKQRGKAVNFAGQHFVLKAPRAGEQQPDTSRLQEFWEWRLKESKDLEELKEFGWWVNEGTFNDEWMLSRLIETLSKTDGQIEADFQVLPVLLSLTRQHPLLCGRALSLIVYSRTADRYLLGHNDDLRRIVEALYSTRDEQAIRIAEKLVDYMTKLGFEAYRHIPRIEQRPVETSNEMLLTEGGQG
jgi:hypothetical protein